MRLRRHAVGLAAVLAMVCGAPAAHAAFGIQSFTADVTDELDKPVTQAGAHPFVGVTSFTFNTVQLGPLDLFLDGNVKDVRVDLPPGLISNPQATPRCKNTDFPSCPPETQVGTEALTALVAGLDVPYTAKVFNMEARPSACRSRSAPWRARSTSAPSWCARRSTSIPATRT